MVRDPAEPAAPLSLPQGSRIAAVASTYHGELVDWMVDSARAELSAAGLKPDDWLVVAAPGTFELPVIARRLALREDVDAVLCFGLVLQGETRHDQVLADSVALALQNVALASGRPVLFGVLTCATLEQARARALPAAQGGQLDKGREVARAAIAAIAALEQASSVGTTKKSMGFGGGA